MPRDKFAAMASRATIPKAGANETGDGGDSSSTTAPRQQEHQQQAENVSHAASSPKRDKFAALASRSNANPQAQQQSDVTTSTTVASPPKRDKLAALVARSRSKSPIKMDTSDGVAQANQQNVPASEQHKTTSNPPKRDKIAALAARSNTPTEPNKSEAPRRNKLAALAARSANNSSTTNQSHDANSSNTTISKSKEELAAEAAIARNKHLVDIKERLSKRKGILDRLDRAEKLTCDLLKIAARTTDALQDLNFSENLSQLSVTYRSTLQELHPLLTVGTEEMIKPYQNHTNETKQSMYAARVEMRLAKERLQILKTFASLEKEARSKEDQDATTTAAIDGKDLTVAFGESDRKRKR